MGIGSGSSWGTGQAAIMTEQEIHKSKFKEIGEEFRALFPGNSRWIDSFLPPLVFVLLNVGFDFETALLGSFAVSLVTAVIRLINRQPLRYALGGVSGVVVAMVISRLVGSAEGYFLPGIISGVFTIIVCLVSVILKRPIVAWTSFITRRWPLDWYWHPKVRPAYSEVTVVWGLFFAIRTLIQFNLFQQEAANILGLVQIVSGWPALIVLLVLSYMYGLWRLQNLGGPSVEEFKSRVEPPWRGQKRGF